jgi:hypothetical protein
MPCASAKDLVSTPIVSSSSARSACAVNSAKRVRWVKVDSFCDAAILGPTPIRQPGIGGVAKVWVPPDKILILLIKTNCYVKNEMSTRR